MHLFETDRLIGRQFSPQDLPALAAILSDPEVMRYSIRGVCDADATRTFIDRCLECYLSHGIGPWALVEKGSEDLVGFCGVGPEQVAGIEETNLGYRLARKWWGRGLGTEAVKGVLGEAFGQNSLESVVVIIEPEHQASLRVAEKAGFSSYTHAQFHGRPVRLYRMTRHGWSALHNNAIPATTA